MISAVPQWYFTMTMGLKSLSKYFSPFIFLAIYCDGWWFEMGVSSTWVQCLWTLYWSISYFLFHFHFDIKCQVLFKSFLKELISTEFSTKFLLSITSIWFYFGLSNLPFNNSCYSRWIKPSLFYIISFTISFEFKCLT